MSQLPLAAPLSRHRQLATLIIVCLANAMLCLDTAVVNTALPFMARDLHSGLSGVQWVVDAYTIALAAAVLSAGSIADRRGRRRLFIIGMVVFTAASLACALAQTIVFLDAARAVQGIGGAIMFASSLALLADAYPGRQRATAMAAYGATIGASFAVGPAVGGALTTWFGWQSVFYVNVPVGAATMLGTLAWLRESRGQRARKLDWSGQVTFSAALVLLVLALLRGNDAGWGSAVIVTELAAAGLLLLAFILVENLVAAPMLPLGLFRRRDFTAAQAAAFAISAGFFGLYLYLSLYLQDVLGLSPLRGGLALLPGTAVIFLVSAASARLTRGLAPGAVLTTGLVVVGIGQLLMTFVGPHSSWTALLPGLIISCAGTGVVNPAQTMLALSSGPAQDSGLLAGAANTFRNGGIAVGVAAFGALIPASAALGHGSAVAYVNGLRHALIIGAGLNVLGAIVVAALIGLGSRPARRPDQVARPAAVAPVTETVPSVSILRKLG